VLVSTTSFASVIRSRYHQTLTTVVSLFKHLVRCLFHKTLTVVEHHEHTVETKFTNVWQNFANFFRLQSLFDFWQKFGKFFQQQSSKNNKLTKVWQNFAIFLSNLYLCKIWQNFDKIIDNKLPISQNFHEIFDVLSLVFFFCYHQFVSYRMTQNLNFWGRWCDLSVFCQYIWYIRFVAYCIFINLPFSFTEKNAGNNRWWRNIICKETNISVSLVIIYFEI